MTTITPVLARPQGLPATGQPSHPTAATKKKRGLTARHRIRVVLTMAACIAALYAIQHLLWPRNYANHGLFQEAWSWGTLLWLGAVIPGLAGLIGMFLYQPPKDLDQEMPIAQLVSWRIVSKGANAGVLESTIRRCQREMAAEPLFRYVIEVVTDQVTTRFGDDDDVTYIAVPPDYRTPNESLFKARAMHYAMLHSELPGDAWIVHLDEETQPTRSGIQGIARMIREEEASGQEPRIGQGALLYHRAWRRHPWLTLADNVRTGDDFARFHFQQHLGVTVFGLHGSYIVVRNDVEKASGGFDFGPQGSVTEDAFWAVCCMEDGRRTRWVDGYLEEQSTQSIGDFLRQRRRWYHGLAKVTWHAPVKLRWRLTIGLNTLLWTLAPFALIYTVAHLGYGGYVAPPVRALANASFASFMTLYLVGLKTNLDEHGITNVFKRLFWYAAQAVMLPAFSALESTATAWALVSRSKGFHVVSKNPGRH